MIKTKGNIGVAVATGIAVILSLVALVVGLSRPGSTPTPDAPTGAQSGPVQNVPWNFTQGAGLGGPSVTFTQGGVIPLGSNQASWRNLTGRTVYIDLAAISVIASSSSTFSAANIWASSTSAIYAYASTTAPRTLYDFTAPAVNATSTLLISNFALATSSTATTTSSYDKNLGGKVVQVPNGGYVVFLQQAQSVSCPTTAGACESATSTNRGFNLQYFVRGYYNP